MAKAGRTPPKRTTTSKHPSRKPKQASTKTAHPIPPAQTITASAEVASEDGSFPIVGIGASAGGLEALEEFLRHMPADSGMAFIIVSHQPTGRASLLPSLLRQCTSMPVLDATDGRQVEPNHVYVAQAGKNLALLRGKLHLMDPDLRDRVPLPIDYFFRSLAEDRKHNAIGMILSGTGTDGTLGLKAIKGESGMTIAQEVESAKYGGMPRNAIAAGAIDIIRPVARMPEQLIAYTEGLFKTPPLSDMAPIGFDRGEILDKIFVLLRDRSGCDFSPYKPNTIRRRIERRMNVHQIEDLDHYLRFVQTDPEELDTLFHELLIGVTSFFRDHQAWEVFAQKGVPLLFGDKSNGSRIRIWVTGCSTGEEAYSLAILLREFLTEQKLRCKIEIFASDVDPQAIEIARSGLYPAGISGDLTPARLQRFFTKEDSWYRVKKDIRDLLVFAVHNLLTDPPFTRMDLVSCRNVLIYLEAKAQQKLLATFHYALKPNGLLWLGSSETLGGFENHLRSIDKKWKLFARDDTAGALPYLQRFAIDAIPPAGGKVAGAERVSPLITQLLLERHVPPSVIINASGKVF